MKRLLIILLSCIPLFSMAQTLTEAQRQEALQSAIKFCDLLERYCNGERTLTTQINAICSGADCSAYDDVKTNKEVTLRNYLLAVQQIYPTRLVTSISQPSLMKSNTYIKPVLSVGQEWGNVGGGSALSTTPVGTLSVESVENVYVVFDVTQEYTSLSKSIDKKIVYDVKNGKITAYITNNGAFISFLNGIMAFTNKQYSTAITCFDIAAQSDRTALKKESYFFAMISSCYLGSFERVIYYAEQYGDQLYIIAYKMVDALQNNQWEECYQYAIQMEAIIDKRSDLNNMQKSGLYIMIANIYANPLCVHLNLEKALKYFEASYALGNVSVGYAIFAYYAYWEEEFIDPETAFEYLYKAAEGGYPPAFYQWGRVAEYGYEDNDEALVWYLKAAQAGSHLAMASAGKLLIAKGEKSKGVEWLKKSLQGSALEAEMEDNIGDAPWPKSRDDVEALLKQNTSTTTYPSQSPSVSHQSTTNHSYYTAQPSHHTSTTTSSSTSTNTSSYSSHSSYHYHSRGKFNEAKDNYDVALSAGYVQKYWSYDFDGVKEKVDVFGEDKFTHGIQVGIRVDPQFGYGFGINTGLYYEYYFDKSQDFYDSDIDYYLRSEEHSLYMPVHFKYSMNFSRWFQLALYGGVGLDCGLKGMIYARSYGETIYSQSLYDDDLDMKRFNASLEYGAAIRIRRVQFNFTMSNGLVNMAGGDGYKVKQGKTMNITMSVYL